jgi:hypothetical protein
VAIVNSTPQAGVCAWPLAAVLLPDNAPSCESPREAPVAAPRSSLTAAYFASHLLAAGRSSSCHIPPAFTQSSRFVYRLKSRDLSLEGLAEGELEESLDALGAVVAPLDSPDAPAGLVSLPE